MRYLNKIKDNYLLLIILLISTILRLYHLDFQSPWLDEVLTLKETSPDLSFSEFKDQVLLREGMPHLYFLIIRELNVICYSSFTPRFFSAILGVLIVFSTYLLGKKIYSKKLGIIASMLMCINWFAILYSQEARPYNLFLFFILLSLIKLLDFIRLNNYKNSILLGITMGLVINAHMLGLLTVFSEFFIIFLIFIYKIRNEKKVFFLNSFIVLVTAVLVALPAYKTFIKATEYKSGWLTLPGQDGFTIIFHDFLGNNELLILIYSLLIYYYFFNLFTQKNIKFNLEDLLKNKLVFGFFILFVWCFFSIIIPIIKSYTSEPMITTRYFISILPAMLILISFGICMIKNSLIQKIILFTIFTFSIVDIVYVKDYYNKITKAQFREVSSSVIIKNKNHDKVVSAYGWIVSYFFNASNKTATIEKTFNNYVNDLRNETIPLESFWYFDANYRPYDLNQQDESFLNQNFEMTDKIEKFDCWARHYIIKRKGKFDFNKLKNNISLNDFNISKNDSGCISMFENGEIFSNEFLLKPGSYQIIINANSKPLQPIQNENAHLIVKINNNIIGDVYLSEKVKKQKNIFIYKNKDKLIKTLSIKFDNDILIGDLDRNMIIYSVDIKRIE